MTDNPAAAEFCILANVTALLSMVHDVPELATVMSPLSPSATVAAAQLPSPRQNVEDEALVPLFRFVTGRLPVTAELDARLIAPKASAVPDRLRTWLSEPAAISANTPAELVERPMTERPDAAEFCILANVTTLLSMVHVAPEPDTVMSPMSPSATLPPRTDQLDPSQPLKDVVVH